jgi:hypothetical protein
MTSSARSSTDCGMVRPSVFAVLRLTTSSNLVGCSTGSSAGLAPLVRHEKPCFHLFHSVGHRREPVLPRQLACSLAARDDEGVSQPEYPVGSLPDDRLERAVELTDSVNLHREHLHFERSSHGLRVFAPEPRKWDRPDIPEARRARDAG